MQHSGYSLDYKDKLNTLYRQKKIYQYILLK
jgi:hypothetical protein